MPVNPAVAMQGNPIGRAVSGLFNVSQESCESRFNGAKQVWNGDVSVKVWSRRSPMSY